MVQKTPTHKYKVAVTEAEGLYIEVYTVNATCRHL